jgi:hypothetical protein
MRCLRLLAAGALFAAALNPRVEVDAAIDGVVHDPVGGHYYKLSTESTTWFNAKARAEELGGYLACITSAAENSFVFNSVAGTSQAYLGGTDEEVEGTWKWISGEAWSYTAWGPGEPNNVNNEDHLHYRTDGAWNDVPGTSSYRYVIEWDTDPNGPPEAPGNLTVTGATDQRVDLTWSDLSLRETNHEVERATAGGSFTRIATLGANVTSYADTTVFGGTTYSYRVRATGSAGPSDYSNTAVVTTPPPTVTGLLGTVVSNTRVELLWTDVASGVTGVEVERGAGCPGANFVLLTTLPPEARSYSDPTAVPETTYAYRTRTVGAEGGKSGYTPPVCVTTPPANPFGLGLVAPTDTRVVVGWTDSSTAETGFEVLRGNGQPGTDFQTLATVGANVTAYTDDTVRPETTYAYRVRATNDDGWSEWTPDGHVTTPPFAPSGAVAAPLSPSRVRVTWQDNSALETGFEVWRARMPAGAFVQVGSPGADVTEFEDRTATQEANYLYRVASVGAAGRSGWSVTTESGTPAMLVVRKAVVKRAKGKPPTLTATGEFDVGRLGFTYTAAATVGIGDTSVAVPNFQAKGKSYLHTAAGVKLQLVPAGSQSSRVRFKFVLEGEAVAALGPDGGLTLSYQSGAFRAVGTVQLAGDAFQPPRRGHLGDPSFHVLSLGAALKPGAKDSLNLKAAFHAEGGVPDTAPEFVVRLGFFEFVAKADQFKRSGDKWTFTQQVFGTRKVTLDYQRGLATVALRGVELGHHPKGAANVPLEVEFGDVWFADSPVMSSTGRALKY